MFQRVLFSTVVLVNVQGMGALQKTIEKFLQEHEKDDRRRQRVMEEIGQMLQGLSLQSLDSKSRDAFTQKFTNFKSFLLLENLKLV